MREGFWKLIEHYEDGKVELYNVSSDLGEIHELSSQRAGGHGPIAAGPGGVARIGGSASEHEERTI